MADNITSKGQTARPSRSTLRLTFRVAGGQVQLINSERLGMITPPSPGAPPEIGTHGGFWVELRDANDRALFHRVLHVPLGDSVEVYSPDGTIRREFGPTSETTFEVLVPDYDDARTVALVGEYLDAEEFRRRKSAQAGEPEPSSRELARFDLPEKGTSGTPHPEVDHERE